MLPNFPHILFLGYPIVDRKDHSACCDNIGRFRGITWHRIQRSARDDGEQPPKVIGGSSFTIPSTMDTSLLTSGKGMKQKRANSGGDPPIASPSRPYIDPSPHE
jgi:hypothetical protein